MTDTASKQLPSLRTNACKIAVAYASHNYVATQDLPTLIATIYASISRLKSRTSDQSNGPEPEQKLTPDQIRKSITPDALISFIDGKPYKMLKRHLTGHGLTPESYRQRYGLPVDYPVVAPSYSTRRSDISRLIGARKPAQA